MEGGLSVPSLATLGSAAEGCVNVFQENNAALRSVGEKVVELVVRQAAFGEVEDADVVLERSGESLDERRLARSWRAVKKVSSSIWNA